MEGAREERPTDGRAEGQSDVQPSRRMRRAEGGACWRRAGSPGLPRRSGGGGRPPRDPGAPGGAALEASGGEEPSVIPRLPRACTRRLRGLRLCFPVARSASFPVLKARVDAGLLSAGSTATSGGTWPSEGQNCRAASLCLCATGAVPPCAEPGPLRDRARKAAPSLSSSEPVALALRSGRLCPGSHACWLWTSLFLADHFPAFPGLPLASLPTVNTSCVRPGSGQRDGQLDRSCQHSWPGGGRWGGVGRALPLPIWSVCFLHGSHSRGSQRPSPGEGQLRLLSLPGHKKARRAVPTPEDLPEAGWWGLPGDRGPRVGACTLC